MGISGLLIIVGALLLVLALLFLFLTVGPPPLTQKARHQSAVSDSLRSLVAAQREQRRQGDDSRRENLALAAAAESKEVKKRLNTSGRMTVTRKLRYARWAITALQFRAIQITLTLICFIPAFLNFDLVVWLFVLFITPSLVTSALDYSVGRRFKAFDRDYPVFLLSYVSLLKTGLNTVTGLEAAARGLEHDSLVRQEIELLLERLRLGLTEEQAISAFGEDIAHPEIELFVQSLLLNRRLGGTLSSTLERLARQVRKRQQFRGEAVAAVALERNSIYMIAGIMSLLLIYLMVTTPDLVFPALGHPIGKIVLQVGVVLIMVGFYWSKKVTNIKV